MPRNNISQKHNKSFTLIELLVVLALVAILSVVVVMTLNPAELIKQARDSNRLSDLSTINTALNLFSADVTSGFMGTSTVIYVSIPDTSPTCANIGLPAIPTSTYTYNCVTSANLRNTNGTGWIPVNFQRISSNSPISQLPIDPQNATSTKYYTYVTGGSWKVMATPESEKYTATAGTDGGSNIGQFEVGNNMSLTPFTDGLVGWWKFDEGSGTTAADSSGWGNNGTASGTTVTAGKVGNALSFNGISDRVTTQLSTQFNDFTVVLWFKDDGVKGGYERLVDKYYVQCFWLGRNGSVPNSWGGGIKEAVDPYGIFISLTDSQWHQIATIRQGNQHYIMGDGASVINSNTVSNTSCDTSFFGIGSWGGAPSQLFSGLIDDVRIYNRALSAAEISALYNATK